MVVLFQRVFEIGFELRKTGDIGSGGLFGSALLSYDSWTPHRQLSPFSSLFEPPAITLLATLHSVSGCVNDFPIA